MIENCGDIQLAQGSQERTCSALFDFEVVTEKFLKNSNVMCMYIQKTEKQVLPI